MGNEFTGFCIKNLTLSILIFWLYFHSTKTVHDLLKEDSQNI